MDEKLEHLEERTESHKNSNLGFYIWLFSLFIYIVFFNITFVSGTSMDPTLEDRDILIMEKASILFNKLDRGDIVSFKHTENDKKVFFIKRIIAIPGDTIDIKEGIVYVNNEKLSEDYLPKDTMTWLPEQESLNITLKENEYFVLGDNRNNSFDSRFEDVGVVHKEKIVAKKLLKIMNL